MSSPRRAHPLPLAGLLVVSALAACSRPEARAPSSSRAGAPSVFVSLDLDAALLKARSQKKLVFVDVYADWCSWCQKLDRDVFSDSRVQAGLSNFLPIRVNAEKGAGRYFAAKYNVRDLPTLLFVDADGNVVKRVEGYMSPERFLKLLDELPGRGV